MAGCARNDRTNRWNQPSEGSSGGSGRPARRLLEQQRRHRLRRLELHREDAAFADRRAGLREVGERGPIGRMRLEVRRQPRLFGKRELAVERADQQRIDVRPVDHGPWVLILRV